MSEPVEASGITPGDEDRCPLCADGHHEYDNPDRCVCCGFDFSTLPPLTFSFGDAQEDNHEQQ